MILYKSSEEEARSERLEDIYTTYIVDCGEKEVVMFMHSDRYDEVSAIDIPNRENYAYLMIPENISTDYTPIYGLLMDVFELDIDEIFGE